MDDSTESDVLYEACSILMRLSARSIKGIRADIDQIELPSLSLEFQNFDEPSLYRADKNGNSSSSSSSLNFVPLLFGLFALGLIGAAARNERIQGWTLLLSRILRRLIRKVKTYVTRLIVTLGPVRKGDLLNLHMKSPGSTWDLRSSTEQSACFALQGRRPKMEDRFTLVEKLGGTQLHLFAIYDGHGGEFAADFAQRWIVNWLEKRSVNYKSRLPLYEPCTSVSPSSGYQEIRIEEPNANNDPPEPALPDKNGTTAKIGRRNSLTSQQQELPSQSEMTKTPSLNRRQHSQQEGQGDLPVSGMLRRGSSGREATRKLELRRKSSARMPIPTTSKRQSLVASGEFDLSSELTTAIMESDKALLVEAKKRNDVAGSTALVAILDSASGQLTVANVGDSRGILCDAKGTVIPLSFDHKPQQLKERKRIQEAGGFISFNGVWRVAGILATSRALGDFPLKDRKLLIAEPDVLSFDLHELRLHQPSFLILASDGLWDAFTNEEAAFYVRQRLHEPHLGAKSLAMQAYQRGSVDNITVLVINLSKL